MEVWGKIKRDIFLMLIVMLVVNAIFSITPFWRDSTDGEDRSGMVPHIDARTGCEYLSVPGGGITPRMDHGEQICN